MFKKMFCHAGIFAFSFFVSIAGVYRCWKYNVEGAGKRCASPPLILREDGTYKMSGEKGTYQIVKGQLILSESKIRGPGKLEQENQITFEYSYKGWKHSVTYLKQEGAVE